MSHDLATKLVVGKIMYKFDKQCRFWGKGALIYLFIFHNFVKICGCRCIWDLKFEEYWEECDQPSDACYYTHYIDINICLLLDAFLNITTFKPWHEYIWKH